MKKLFQLLPFCGFFLFAKITTAQVYYALAFEVDYPTPAMNDGKIIPALAGNYTSPVEYHARFLVDNTSLIFADTLENLNEYNFSEDVYLYVVDQLTGDTLLSALNKFTEDVELTWTSIIPPTDGYSCDGSFDGDLSVPFTTQFVTWIGDGGVITNVENLSLFDRCAGYYIFYIPTNFETMHTMLYFEPMTSSTGAFDIEVFSTPTSNGFCTATATATVIGGQSPYQYYWDGVSGTNNMTNLCQGVHTLKVVDANADSTMVLVGIADSSYYFEDTTFNGTFVDTIYFTTAYCGLDDGMPIDSVALTYTNFFNDSLVEMGFTVYQGMFAYYILDTASYGPPSYGWYLIDLTQFCLSKQLNGDVLKFQAAHQRNFFISSEEFNTYPFLVYPNPVNDALHLPTQGYQSVTIYNLIGKTIFHDDQPTGVVDVSMVQEGIYEIVFYDEHLVQISSQKIIIKH